MSTIPKDGELRAFYRFLKEPRWLETLSTDSLYAIKSDDDPKVELNLSFSADGDAWVNMNVAPTTMLRFRTLAGGAQDPRIRDVMMILAEAMRLDADIDARKEVENSKGASRKLKMVHDLLDRMPWPPDLEHGRTYRIQTDDSDGDEDFGWLAVSFTDDGDAFVSINYETLVETKEGYEEVSKDAVCKLCTNGRSLRTRRALMMLAETIRLVEAERGGNNA